MGLLTVEGVVENGKIRLRDDIALPEHAVVYVIVRGVPEVPPAHFRSPRLVRPGQAADFAKQVVEVSTDAGQP